MSDWMPLNTAPRDGTVIELRCTYGIAPWYELYYFGTHPDFGGLPRWTAYGDPGSGITEDASFSWRPYHGNPDDYIDPTHGAQETLEYWQAASECRKFW